MRPAFTLTFLLLATSVLAQPALRERMLAIEDQRGTSGDDLETLKQGLASRDVTTRRQAIRAIGRLEQPDLMRIISPLLTDPNDEVRIETVNAIGQLARGAEGVAAARSRLLARAKGEQRPRVRGAVAATLGRLAYTTPEDVRQVERVIAPLVPLAPSTVNLDEIAGAVEGLEALIRQSRKLSPPSADTLARLRVAAKLEGRQEDTELLVRIRRLATAALSAAGRVDREVLEFAAADSDDEVRRITMVAAREPIDGREAVLRKGLADPEARVRYAALQSWGRALQSESCAPILSSLHDTNTHVKLLAIDLLGAACRDQAEATAALSEIAETVRTARDRWHAPAHALVSLAKVSPDEAGKRLPTFASHPLWQVRMYAAHAAGAIAASEVLLNLAGDDHDNVREAALNQLISLKRPETQAVAMEAIRRPDYQLLITAARALGESSDQVRAADALTAALAHVTEQKRDTSRDPRMAMLNGLERLEVHRPEALQPYLRDFDPAIAVKAAEILRKWGATATTPMPQPLPITPIKLADVAPLRNARLKFVMTGKGAFELRLFTDEAPLSAFRVATLVRQGYYNGLTFHRVVPNFVIQGGSPGANEYAGDGPYMRDEVGLRSHRRGAVGISTRGRDTGDAQIFVDLVDLPQLDHNYTVFGEVVSGMDVVDQVLEGDVIERVELVMPATSSRDR